MKNILTLIALATVVAFSSCTGGNEKKDETAEAGSDLPKGMMEVDLTSEGLPMVAIVPDSTTGILDISSLSYGETEIRVGDHFQIKIAEGGDMELKKTDLAGDLLYKASFIEEKDSAIVYKQEIKGSNVEPMYHFYLIKEINGISYEIQSIQGETFSEKQVQKMLDAALKFSAAEEKGLEKEQV